MPTSYTSLLGLALPVTGELSGTWGDVVNTEITDLLDSAIAGYATADVTSGDWTLSTTGSGLPNESRMAIIIPTALMATTQNARSGFVDWKIAAVTAVSASVLA